MLWAICEAMKKTLFTAMLAAALLGGGSGALANTGYSQDKEIAEDNAPNHIFAVTAQERPGAFHANLLIYDDEDAAYEALKNVVGGYATNETSAYDNLVTMRGGKVTELLAGGYVRNGGIAQGNCVVMTGGEMSGQIAGGYAFGNGYVYNNTVDIGGDSRAVQVYGGITQNGLADGNTVTLSGGNISRDLVGGYSLNGDVGGNTAIVTGGSVENVCGAAFLNSREIKGNKVLISGGNVGTARAYSQHSTQVKFVDNVIIMSGGTAGSLQLAERIHLAGAGFDGTIEGVEQIVGRALECGTVGSCDSIDIYGAQISGTRLTARVALNFHLMNGLLTEAAPMVTLGDTLNLSRDLTLSFDALDYMEWKPGDSVTLVSDALGITIDESLLNKEYNIYSHGHPETIVGTGKIELEQSNTVLKLTVQGVPEPATGTLSLLALAALAARRRK